jgi:GntR family L-lactate dehydrogenase operon transcriptional regulator
MLNDKNEQEYLVLTAIYNSEEPLGSGAIREELRLSGFELSEATAGRLLREYDRQGCTLRIGFRGRHLTDKGKKRLGELIKERERNHFGNELLNTLEIKSKDELIDILVARRVIEKETARLAALNATDLDIDHLKRIIERHNMHYLSGIGGAEEDIQFHRLIGKMAGNKVLMAAMDLIRQDGQMSPVFEHIRKHVNSTVVSDHRKILSAIASRKPDRAEVAMIEHINNIIEDVERYWAEPDGSNENVLFETR